MRYGSNHKRILEEKYSGEYHFAGLEVIWMPILTVVIIVMLWALFWVVVGLIKDN
jgi:hypothetical protein